VAALQQRLAAMPGPSMACLATCMPLLLPSGGALRLWRQVGGLLQELVRHCCCCCCGAGAAAAAAAALDVWLLCMGDVAVHKSGSRGKWRHCICLNEQLWQSPICRILQRCCKLRHQLHLPTWCSTYMPTSAHKLPDLSACRVACRAVCCSAAWPLCCAVCCAACAWPGLAPVC
jgi:hypothetical protein